MISRGTISLQKGILALLILLGPWHAFLATWLKIPLLSIWREALVGILFITTSRSIIKRNSIDYLDAATLAFTLAAFLWLPFQKNAQWLLGFRFDVLPFLFLIVMRRIPWGETEKLLNLFWISATAVMVFGIMHALFLPQNFLAHFGYAIYQGACRPELGLPACQYLEHTDKICRAVATFGGPTRYGVYLLLVLGLLMGKGKKLFEPKWAALCVLALGNIVLTFSRSIWIGAVLMIITAAALYAFPKARLKKAFLFGTAGITIALLIWLLLASALKTRTSPWTAPPLIKTIFVRESSTGEHARLL
ncbi:hypothetical protein HYV58_00730, partial [Candidatus Peregrinibacteria bacterium]|nr:hypothetical protein [Candidatus Peregrinibacteria bacterium]